VFYLFVDVLKCFIKVLNMFYVFFICKLMFLTSMVLSVPIDTELRNLASKKLERHSTVWCTCTTYFDTLNRIVNEAVVLVY